MADITYYSRLEPRPRDNDFTFTLAAPVRDPLWFLSRQWQMGEFVAEDTGSLAFIQYSGHTAPLPRWRLGSTESPLEQNATLEAQTLKEPFGPDRALQVELGHDFADYLRDEAAAGAAALLTKFLDDEDFVVSDLPSSPPVLDPVDAATRRFLAVCAGRTLDGYAIYTHAKSGGGVPASITTDPTEIAQIQAAFTRLVTRVSLVYGDVGTADPATWVPERLEYRLEVVGVDPSGDGTASLVHEAEPGSDGEYDWFSFDAVARNAGGSDEAPHPEAFSIIPARVHFDGMPATRFWNFEENTLSLPDVQPTGPDDVLKLFLTDFMLVHANDWYVFPFAQKVGTLAKTHWVIVHDVFGHLTLVSRADEGTTAPGADRWTMFSITDTSGSMEGLTDYFVLPPTPGQAMQLGTVLEDVRFGRDETANMAFAVEEVTTSPIGEARSGRERNAQVDARDIPAPTITSDFPLRYSIESEIPANWAPLLPVRVAPTSTTDPSIVLEVGNALKPTGGDQPEPVPRLSKILNPEGLDPYRLVEEEVPREGLKVERIVFRARGTDGSTRLWVQRRRRVGAGESQSGLVFDQAISTAT